MCVSSPLVNVFHPLLSEAGIIPTKIVGSCLLHFQHGVCFLLWMTYMAFKSVKKSLQKSITVCIIYQFSLLDELQIQVRNQASVLSLIKKFKGLRRKITSASVLS